YLKFADNVKFSVKDAARNETLSSAAPTAFGFLGATTPAPISIQGTTAAPSLLVQPSAAPLARTLSIVGGDITITGPAALSTGTIQARGGLVQIVSVKSVASGVSGAMSLETASQIISSPGARGEGGGIVADVASLSLTGGSQIVRSSSSTRVAATGGVTINATESIRIDGASPPDASGNST